MAYPAQFLAGSIRHVFSCSCFVVSKVTNLILVFSGSENEPEVALFLNRFPNEGKGFRIVAVDDPSLPKGWYGGTKYLECCLYLGAYNHFNAQAFLAYLRTYPWEDPESVQLLVKEQYDDVFQSFLVCALQ
jgi:hypothetical protein